MGRRRPAGARRTSGQNIPSECALVLRMQGTVLHAVGAPPTARCSTATRSTWSTVSTPEVAKAPSSTRTDARRSTPAADRSSRLVGPDRRPGRRRPGGCHTASVRSTAWVNRGQRHRRWRTTAWGATTGRRCRGRGRPSASPPNRNYWVVTVSGAGAAARACRCGASGTTPSNRFMFSGSPNSRKARNIAANPHVVVMVDDTVECVSVEGVARVIEPGEPGREAVDRALHGQVRPARAGAERRVRPRPPHGRGHARPGRSPSSSGPTSSPPAPPAGSSTDRPVAGSSRASAATARSDRRDRVTAMQTPVVGVIGLGILGRPVAEELLAAGDRPRRARRRPGCGRRAGRGSAPPWPRRRPRWGSAATVVFVLVQTADQCREVVAEVRRHRRARHHRRRHGHHPTRRGARAGGAVAAASGST